jgi:hypothetical protein
MPMECVIHPGVEAAGECAECGRAFCEKCISTYAGKQLCHACAAQIAERLKAEGSEEPAEGPEEAEPVTYPPLDLGRATFFGLAGAVIGAVVWILFTVLTGYYWGFIGALVGIAVGRLVRVGARAPSVAGSVISVILTLIALYVGMAGLTHHAVVDYLTEEGTIEQYRGLGLVIASLLYAPRYTADSGFLVWLFLAFGLYEGWREPQTK